MTGSTLGPSAGGGLLAKKGAARPAMRRQGQIQQTGFGNSGGGGLSGWLTGSEDDCGWNDMGDGPAPTFAPARSAIGLTAMTNAPDSLYVDASSDDPDWDEAGSYDDDSSDWNASAPTVPANPVSAMQERLQAEATAPTPARAEFALDDTFEVPAPDDIQVGLLGQIHAAWSGFIATIFGKASATVLHLDPALRDRLRAAAAFEGVDEADLAERAIEDYLGAIASSNVNASATSLSWN